MAETQSTDHVNKTSSSKEVKYVPTNDGKLLPITEEHKSDTLYLYFVVITACLPMITAAGSFVWTSPVIPKFLSNDTSINPLDAPITTMEISLMVSLPSLTGPIGAFMSAIMSDRIGRKKWLQLIAINMVIFSIIIAFSHKIIYVIICRCIIFMFLAGAIAIVPIFITEVSEDHNRAKFGCLMGLVLPLGTLYSFAFGPPFSVRDFTLILVIPSVIFLILSFFIVESPIFFLSKGNKKQFRNAIEKLRSNKTEKELELEFNRLNEILKVKENNKTVGVVSLFKLREARIGVLVALIPIVILNCSGATILMQFLGPVFNEVSTTFSGDNIAIIVAVVKCVIFLCTTFVVERTGRKPLLFYSCLGCSIPLAVLGWFFYLKYTNSPLMYEISWLPFTALLIYIVSYSIGLGPIAPSIAGELFVTDLRAAASSTITSIAALLVFCLSFAFPIVADAIGYHWCFLVFSFFCLLGSLAIYFLVPETRGRSLDEIQEILKNYKFDWKRKA